MDGVATTPTATAAAAPGDDVIDIPGNFVLGLGNGWGGNGGGS